MMNWREIEPSSRLRFAVLGDPIEHSLSPKMHNAALGAMGIEGEYLALRVMEVEFEECVAHLAACGFRGVNVTIPHKYAAAEIGAADDEHVGELSAANALLFSDNIFCRNTDVVGFLKPVDAVTDGKALVLGAGATAATAAYCLRKRMPIRLWNRSAARAEEISFRFAGKCEIEFCDEPDPSGCSLVINTTPLGLKPGDMPTLIWENLDRSATVFDLAYREGPTDFLATAASAGAKTIDGRQMLVGQGAASLAWWLGAEARLREIESAMTKAVMP